MSGPGRRTWTALLLLLGGGVLLGILGFRHLALEREKTDLRARELERRRLAEAVANAPRLARQPRSAPLMAWEVEPPRLPRSTAADDEDESLLKDLLEAARVPGFPADIRLGRYDKLTRADHPSWLRQIASYHAGLACLELEDAESAKEYLTVAARALPLLVTDGVRVRASALQQLALIGLRAGNMGPLDVFLDVVKDGRRLARGEVVGPADLLIELTESCGEELITVPAPVAERLQAATRRARLGVAALPAVPKRDDLAVVGSRVAHRRSEIELRALELSALVAPPAGFPVRAHAALVPLDASLPPLSARLAPPLYGVVVTVDREPLQAKSLLALIGLALGLGLYLIGVVFALRGWSRSRRAARRETEFTAAVSHEMKTPIASVRAMAEMLQADGDPELTQRYAGRIETEMQRLGTTVRNVLDAARIEQGVLPVRPEAGDPAVLVASTAEALRADLERRGYALELEVQPADAAVAVDADALGGVLRNLVDNAVKFSGGEKRIRVEAMPVPNGYRMAVLDRGIGLESGKHERLFGRFYRGEAAREGAVPGVGLGLHIARQVIDAHGGSLSARNRPGGGAAFEIHLPAEDANR